MLPPDNHVHSEFSWDAIAGAMEATCERAVEIGLPSVAFTEHADFSPWHLSPGDRIADEWRQYVDESVLTPPAIDLRNYHATLEWCRERFPELRILSGVELSEPHWFLGETAELLARGKFDRVLASVHSVGGGAEYVDGSLGMRRAAPGQVIRNYLAETLRLIEGYDAFEVLTHIDYPVRYWPEAAEPFDPFDFQDEYRTVLRALAGVGKVLEFNTRRPLDPVILQWWRQEGGGAISFASDAHMPGRVGNGFAEAAAVARAAGFRPTDDPYAFWVRD